MTLSNSSRTVSRLERVVAGSLTAVALVVLSVLKPSQEPVICPFRILTGMLCPLCGITRGVSDVLHGEWLAAVEHHPLSPLVAMLMISVMILSLAGRTLANWISVWLGAAILIVGLLRLGLEVSIR